MKEGEKMKYLIKRAYGNFTGPIEYSHKSKEEIRNEILNSNIPFDTIASFDLITEAIAFLFSFCNDKIIIDRPSKKSTRMPFVAYDIYKIEEEKGEIKK